MIVAAVPVRLSIGAGSRRRSESQAIDLPSGGGVNLGRLLGKAASSCPSLKSKFVGLSVKPLLSFTGILASRLGSEVNEQAH